MNRTRPRGGTRMAAGTTPPTPRKRLPMRHALPVVAVLVVVAGMASVAANEWGPGRPSGEVTKGRRLYGSSCAACHGAEGEGAPDWRRSDAYGVFPPPPHDSSGHTWHHPDGLLFRIIREGCAAYATADIPCNMPAFGDRLSDDDIRAIVEFLRKWWTADERAFQASVSRDDPFP